MIFSSLFDFHPHHEDHISKVCIVGEGWAGAVATGKEKPAEAVSLAGLDI
jgi:hypothetical protein